MGHKRGLRAVIIVIIILLIPITIAVIFRENIARAVTRTANIRVPIIRTTMKDADGYDNVVQAGFSVRFEYGDRRVADQINQSELQNALVDILHSLDYETMVAFDGVEYMNETVTALLSERIETNDPIRVFLTDFITGDNVWLSSPTDAGNRVSDIFRGLFRNSNSVINIKIN